MKLSYILLFSLLTMGSLPLFAHNKLWIILQKLIQRAYTLKTQSLTDNHHLLLAQKDADIKQIQKETDMWKNVFIAAIPISFVTGGIVITTLTGCWAIKKGYIITR